MPKTLAELEAAHRTYRRWLEEDLYKRNRREVKAMRGGNAAQAEYHHQKHYKRAKQYMYKRLPVLMGAEV